MEFIDLKAQYQALKSEIDEAVLNVMSRAAFIMGDEVHEFEKRFADYLGVKHVVSCANGTDALQLIYMAREVGEGDAVFVSDMTFIASVEPASFLGATPVFCDIDINTFNISPASLRSQIELVLKEGRLRPKCIVAVDFLGNPCDYEEIAKIAEEYGMFVIEDAAQSISGEYRGRKCGSLGDVAATSFFPTKPLGCYGDGGAVMTNLDGEAELMRSLRVHGSGKSKYDNVRIGLNSRLDTIQAAVLNVKLGYLGREINMRQELAKKYTVALEGKYKVQSVQDGNICAYAQFSLLTNSGQDREGSLKALKDRGIPSMVYYPNPLHVLPVFHESGDERKSFPVAEKYSAMSFSIPFSPYMDERDFENVVSALSENAR
jgi:dTDP-4-amino-4,6-dideoxygalactose transaminase